jgi:hypothetical protein
MVWKIHTLSRDGKVDDTGLAFAAPEDELVSTGFVSYAFGTYIKGTEESRTSCLKSPEPAY